MIFYQLWVYKFPIQRVAWWFAPEMPAFKRWRLNWELVGVTTNKEQVDEIRAQFRVAGRCTALEKRLPKPPKEGYISDVSAFY